MRKFIAPSLTEIHPEQGETTIPPLPILYRADDADAVIAWLKDEAKLHEIGIANRDADISRKDEKIESMYFELEAKDAVIAELRQDIENWGNATRSALATKEATIAELRGEIERLKDADEDARFERDTRS